MPKTERQVLVHKIPDRVSEPKLRRLVSAGIGTLLGILAFVALASIIDPQNLLNTAGSSVEVVKHNPNQETVPKKAIAEVAFKRQDQRITIQHGATIYQIAIDAYGANTVLGMDLIKEFNPQIEDLNWVSAGQDLLLPSLTRETLLRQEPDGSYRLIVGSFRRQTGADEYARLLSKKGYEVSITPRRVADNLLLHRVEIDGLKNLEEANQIWQTGLRNEWLAFAGNPEGPIR